MRDGATGRGPSGLVNAPAFQKEQGCAAGLLEIPANETSGRCARHKSPVRGPAFDFLHKTIDNNFHRFCLASQESRSHRSCERLGFAINQEKA